MYPGNVCARTCERKGKNFFDRVTRGKLFFFCSLFLFRSVLFFPCFSEFLFFRRSSSRERCSLKGCRTGCRASLRISGISFNPPLRFPPLARTCRPACRISAPKRLDTRTRAARRRFLLVKKKFFILESQIFFFYEMIISNYLSFNQFGNIIIVEVFDRELLSVFNNI